MIEPLKPLVIQYVDGRPYITKELSREEHKINELVEAVNKLERDWPQDYKDESINPL